MHALADHMQDGSLADAGYWKKAFALTGKQGLAWEYPSLRPTLWRHAAQERQEQMQILYEAICQDAATVVRSPDQSSCGPIHTEG